MIATPDAPPAWAVELDRKLDRLAVAVGRLATPTDLLTAAQVAQRCGKSERAVKELAARHFTDPRSLDEQRPGVVRMIYSDEVEVWITGGLSALRQFRRDCNRLRRGE